MHLVLLWIFYMTGSLECAVFTYEIFCLVLYLYGHFVIIPSNSHILSQCYLISKDWLEYQDQVPYLTV